MSSARTIGLDEGHFRRMARSYRRRWKVGVCAVGIDGTVVFEESAGAWSGAEHQAVRKLAVDEALRWGEPAVQPAPREMVVWAVPLMHNAEFLGGLVAGISEKALFGAGAMPVMDVRRACADLLAIAEHHNWTNAALMEARRREYQRERVRAEAIHAHKASPVYDLRALYQLEEPQLMAAIRRGDRGQARAILNHLLVGMIHRSAGRLDLARSFFMELVATMSRTAVEAGGGAEELLGANFDSIARLARIDNDEDLAAWLHEMLERIMDSIRDIPEMSSQSTMAQAMAILVDRCCDDLSRDQVAEEVGMSRAHFSRQFSSHFGKPFTKVLLQMRAERAADLLVRGDKPLKLIAIQCGFSDQSHLTKVFRSLFRITPAAYRKEHRNTKG